MYRCVQLSYTTHHGAVLIIFTLNLQTSITAQILSTEGAGWAQEGLFTYQTQQQPAYMQWSLPSALTASHSQINSDDNAQLYAIVIFEK